MARSLEMDLSLLEQDEFEYERRIRNHYEPPAQARLMSSLGIVAHWIREDDQRAVDPLTIQHGIEEGDLVEEMELCASRLNELYEQVHTAYVVSGSFENVNVEDARKIGSRLIHYDLRIRRIDVSAFTPAQQGSCTQARQKGDIARTIMAGVLSSIVSRSNTTGTNSTGTSNGTTTTVATEQNGSGHGLSTDHQVIRNAPDALNVINSTALSDGSAPQFDINTAPYDAAVEARKRQDAEAARRNTEYQICSARIGDLNDDVQFEYCSPMGPRRRELAHGMMLRLKQLQQTLSAIRVLNTDPALKDAIERDTTTLVQLQYILQANVMVHAQLQMQQQATQVANPQTPAVNTTGRSQSAPANTQSRAQSTIHPPPQTQFFDRAIDGLTFNVSDQFSVNDSQLDRAVNGIMRDAQMRLIRHM